MTPQSDEDEIWRQIVASYHEPAETSVTGRPWPEQEDLPPEARDRGDRFDDGFDAPEEPMPPGYDPDDDHYEPPPPPPLPKLDTTAKLSWLALFGGPAYLLLAAVFDLPMDGGVVFTAVAAFIGGFVALVVRMGDSPPPDSGWDDGAVI